MLIILPYLLRVRQKDIFLSLKRFRLYLNLPNTLQRLTDSRIARNTRHVRLRTKHFGVSRSRLEHALCMRFEK